MPDFLNDPLLDQVVNPSQEVSDPLLDAAADSPVIAKPGEVDVAATLQMIVSEAQALEPDVDRTKLGQLGVSLGRGVISVAEIAPQLRLLATSRIEKITGENFFTRHNNLVALSQIKQAEELKATKFPVSRDETLTLRKSMGIVGEAIPQLVPATVVGILTRGRSIPMSMNLFAGTAAMQAVGSQFMESAIETGDLDKAVKEAGATGLVVFGLSRAFPANALFAKLPKQLAANAALRVSARMAFGTVGESIEEGVEAVMVEAVKGLVRSDPEKFKNIYRGDPEFWGGVLEQMIGGAGAGGVAGVTVGSVEVAQRFRKLSDGEITEKTIDEAHELLLGTKDVTTDLSKLSVEDRKGILSALEESKKLEQDLEGKSEAEAAELIEQAQLAAGVPVEPGAEVEPPPVPIEPSRARRIMEDLGERAKVAEEAEAAAAEPVPPTEGPIRDQQERIRQLLVELGPPETVSEVDTLKEEVSEVTRAGKEAVRAVKVQALDDLKQLRLDAINKQRPIDALKGELSRLAKSNIKGREVPKKLLTDIGKIKTIGDLAKGIRTVRETVAIRNKSDAVANLKSAIKKVGDPKKLREQYREAVGRLIDSVRLKDMSEPMRARLNRIKDVIAKEPDLSLSPRIQSLIGELDKVPVSQISTDEVTALAEALESIAENQTKFEKFSRKAQAQRIDTLSTKISGEIDQFANKIPKGPGGRLLRSKRFRSGLLSYLRFSYGLPENSDLDTLSELLGGEDSATWQQGFKVVHDGQREGMGGYFRAKDALGEFLKARGRDFGSAELSEMSKDLAGEATRMGKALNSLGVENKLRKEATLQKVTLGKETVQISSAERIALLNTMADQETFDQVIFRKRPIRFKDEETGKARTISLRDYQQIVDGASDLERGLSEFMLEQINGSIKQDMAAHSKAKNLYDITKKETWYPRHAQVQGTPADVTADGLDVAFAKRSGINPSITKARTENINTPIEIKDAFVEYNNLAWTNSMYTQMEPAIRTFKKVLNSAKVRKSLDDSKSASFKAAYNTVFDQVAREITGAPPLRGLVSKGALPILQKLPRGLLGLNIRIGAYQTVSSMLFAHEIPVGFVLRAVKERAMFSSKVDADMMLDPMMRFRMEASSVGIVNDASDTGIPLLEPGRKGEGAMAVIRIPDRATVRIGWRAGQLMAEAEAAKADKKPSADETRRRHWELSEKAITRTQPMFDTVHVPVRAVEAKSDSFLKFKNFFRAQRNKLVTMQIRSVMRIVRNPTRRVIMRESENIVRSTLLNTIAIRAIAEIVTFGVLDKEKRSWERFLAGVIRTLSGIAFLGDWVGSALVKMLFRGQPFFDPAESPIEAVIEAIARGSGKAVQGASEGDMKKMLAGVVEVGANVAAVEGIPAPFLVRETEKLIDAIIEDDKKHGVTPP